MFRLVLTSVTIHHHGRGSFLKWLAESVHTRDRNGHGLHDPRAAALLSVWVGRYQGFGHHSSKRGVY